MSINSENTKEIILKYGKSQKDTGDCKVQIAIISSKIAYLTPHLTKNKKDFGTKRALQKLLSKRKKLLKYFKRSASLQQYEGFLSELGIRG